MCEALRGPRGLAKASTAVICAVLVVQANSVAQSKKILPGPVDTKPLAAVGGTHISKMQLRFEANRGQFDQRVKFVSRGRGHTLFLTRDGSVLSLTKSVPNSEVLQASSRREGVGWPQLGPPLASRTSRFLAAPGGGESEQQTSVSLMLTKANPNATASGVEEVAAGSNYFIGNDPRKWRTGVPNYAGVRYKNIYPGIDLFYYGNENGQLEYDFVVAPGADPRNITLDLGADSVPAHAGRKPRPPLRLDGNGDLIASLDGSAIRFHKPVVYQRDVASGAALTRSAPPFRHASEIEGHYRLVRGRVQFQISSYDHTRPLIIDPVMVFSTYFGGSMGENSYQVRLDTEGNMYIAGNTSSPDFPLANPLENTLQAITAAFVSKFSPDGSKLLYSTYIGGNAPGYGASANALVVDEAGNAYISGWTSEPDFPTTPGVFETGLNASCAPLNCGFVAKLSPDGSSLLFSTYFPASAGAIATDSSGNVYLTGGFGSGFPTTPGAFQTTQPGQYSGYGSGFVTKLNPTGTALVYSTYLGGTGESYGDGIAVDSSGNAYISGLPGGTSFSGINCTVPNDASQGAFVAKLNASGSGLLYCTLLGAASDIAVDGSGDAYVTGTTPDWLRIVVSKLDPTGANLTYSTQFGGSDVCQAWAIAVDVAGNAYVTGRTAAIDFPLVNPVQPFYGGGPLCSPSFNCSDVFVTEVSADGSKLLFSTYVGDVAFEQGQDIAVDNQGNIFVTGYTESFDFPLAHAFQATNKATAGANAFVLKINTAIEVTPQRIIFGAQRTTAYQPQPIGVTTAPQTITFTNNTQASMSVTGLTFSGADASDFSVGSDSCSASSVAAGDNCTIDVTFTPSAGGMREADLFLNTSAPGSPFDVSLRGDGTTVAVAPQILNFGGVDLGTTSTQALTVTNYGTVNLTVNELYNPATDPSVTISQNTCAGAVLSPMASCTASISFSPDCICVWNFPLISVYDSAPDSPQVATILGHGVGAQASLSAGILAFYSQPVGFASAAQTITVTNNGNASLIFAASAVTLHGTNAAEFTMSSDNCSGQTIAPNGTCSVSVSFTPGATGVANAAVNFSDNVFGNVFPSPQTVVLYGQGVDFTLAIASGSSASATVSPGGTATYALVVTSEGSTGNLTVSLACSGAPSEATCSVSPLTPGTDSAQTATVTVATTAASQTVPPFERLRPPGRETGPLMICLLLLLAIAMWKRGMPGLNPASLELTVGVTRRLRRLAVAAILFGAATYAACGGGGGGTSGPPPNPGTPAGTYTLDVTATYTSGSSTLAHDTKLTLVVN